MRLSPSASCVNERRSPPSSAAVLRHGSVSLCMSADVPPSGKSLMPILPAAVINRTLMIAANAQGGLFPSWARADSSRFAMKFRCASALGYASGRPRELRLSVVSLVDRPCSYPVPTNVSDHGPDLRARFTLVGRFMELDAR